MSTTTATESYRIVAGPGEMDLMASLFGRGRDNPTVTFTLETEASKFAIDVVICGLEHDCPGSSYYWKFIATVAATSWPKQGLAFPGEKITSGYSHRMRKGIANYSGATAQRRLDCA